jgi:surface carbohydrate biosynthesis protein
MIIALPIEIKSREYLPKLNLAYHIIKNSNHDVIIGKKSEIYSIFKKSKNIFLISKSGPKNKFNFSNQVIRDNIFSILDEEGPLANLRFEDFKNRCSDKVLALCNYYFTWGNADKKLIIKKTNIKCKILNFGHPKFDIVDKKKNFFLTKEKYIKNKFKKFVFFASNFHQDQIMDNKNYLNWRNKQAINDKNFHKRQTKILKKDLINYKETIIFLKKLALKNHNINFVFRPHPRQDITKVKKSFGKVSKNFFIEDKFSISPYISTCDFYLHRGSTSVIEAMILKKKIIYLKDYNYNERTWMNKIGFKLSNRKNEIELVSKIISRKMQVKINKNSDVVQNIGSKKFYKYFIKFIKNKKFNKINSFLNIDNIKKTNNIFNKTKSNIKNFLIKFNIVTKYLLSIDEDLILPKSYGFAKFNSLTSKEIKKDLLELRISNDIKLVKKISLQKINTNSFLLKSNN